MGVGRDNLTNAVMLLLRDYIDQKGAKYTDIVSYIAALRPDEGTMREVYTERKDSLDAKLRESKAYLAALEGH